MGEKETFTMNITLAMKIFKMSYVGNSFTHNQNAKEQVSSSQYLDLVVVQSSATNLLFLCFPPLHQGPGVDIKASGQIGLSGNFVLV